jgi:hypothetical protein
MTNRLQHYNAFGGVVVKNNSLTITMTAVQESRTIHRTLKKEVSLSAIMGGETAVAQFGIFLEGRSDKHKVVMYEIVKAKSGKPLLDIPEVRQAIIELANIVRNSIQ